MATFQIWSSGTRSTTDLPDNPLHTVEAHKIHIDAQVITFRDEHNSILHAVVYSPGIVIKKIG
jgi:hypothetical protein